MYTKTGQAHSHEVSNRFLYIGTMEHFVKKPKIFLYIFVTIFTKLKKYAAEPNISFYFCRKNIIMGFAKAE